MSTIPGTREPSLIIFDVNETLSDMSPMADRFVEAGAPGHLAAPWFAGLLRDGFALTVTGGNPAFADLARDALHGLLLGRVDDVDAAVQTVMDGFSGLPLHPDVECGVRALRSAGHRLVTLSNGAAAVAERLLTRHGIADQFERLLSVQDAPAWKPASTAYRHALEVCAVAPAEAMLVAVHPWDIHGAHEAGLSTAWVNRSGGPYPAHFAPADVIARSIEDLAAQLEAPPAPNA